MLHGLRDELSNIWNRLSFSKREDAKALLACGITMAVLAAIPFGVALGLGAAVGTAGILGAIGAGIGLARHRSAIIRIPGLIWEICDGDNEVIWKNKAGQTIISTLAQKNNLRMFERIRPMLEFNALKRFDVDEADLTDTRKHMPLRVVPDQIRDIFRAAADAAVVVKDIEGGNGKFRLTAPLAVPK